MSDREEPSRVATWIDPKERDGRMWGEEEDARSGEDVRGVVARAHYTAVPYEFEHDGAYGSAVVEDAFEDPDYRHARLLFHGSVQANGRVKLLVKGHLWGEEERHLRFRSQFRREAPPTGTVPFGTYTVWSRYRYGTVRRNDGLTFEPDQDGTTEELEEREWSAIRAPVQFRIAELELVRNPSLARYVLRDRGEWEETRDYFRWNPSAFEYGP